MRLAPSQKERLRKGLERFANCRDSIEDYQALSRGWSSYWPVDILSDPSGQTTHLAWHPVCHRLFLFYRDCLRALWNGKRYDEKRWVPGPEDFLMGLSRTLEICFEDARKNLRQSPWLSYSEELFEACRVILERFSDASLHIPVRLTAHWDRGDFSLRQHNDFQRAFYFLLRQSWRARVCPSCKVFFLARKPKQTFCGTGCSGANRLASKRRWWNRVGTERRKKMREHGTLERNRRKRKSR